MPPLRPRQVALRRQCLAPEQEPSRRQTLTYLGLLHARVDAAVSSAWAPATDLCFARAHHVRHQPDRPWARSPGSTTSQRARRREQRALYLHGCGVPLPRNRRHAHTHQITNSLAGAHHARVRRVAAARQRAAACSVEREASFNALSRNAKGGGGGQQPPAHPQGSRSLSKGPSSISLWLAPESWRAPPVSHNSGVLLRSQQLCTHHT